MPAEVVELRSEAEFKEAFPVIRELHCELDERSYLDLLAEMAPPATASSQSENPPAVSLRRPGCRCSPTCTTSATSTSTISS
jgi:hypothetical protein